MIPDDDRALFEAEVFKMQDIPTRKVTQIVLEVPVEKRLLAADVCSLGHVVVARVDKSVSAAAPSNAPTTAAAGERPTVAPQGLSAETSHKLAKQAGRLCKDPIFWRFMTEYTALRTHDERVARQRVLEECDIESRRELDTNERAGNAWRKLESKFTAWKAVVPA